MSEIRKIIHIETSTFANLDNRQIAVRAGNDPNLGYRMWGGKDGAGNLTYWLAKDKDARVDGLTILDVAGASGILKHDTAGVVSSGATIGQLSDVVVASPSNGDMLVYNSTASEWQNSSISLTLDGCYNNDSGERSVYVDDGDIRFHMDDVSSKVRISLDSNTNDGAAFLVDDDNSSEYFVIEKTNDEGPEPLHIETSGADIDFNCVGFAVYNSGTTIMSASGCTFTASSSNCTVGSYSSTGNLNLVGRNNSTPFNDASNLTLSGFTATSIIGALNELRALH